VCQAVSSEARRPAFDVLKNGAEELVAILQDRFPRLKKSPTDKQLASA
jgi:hypothetical protein